MLVGRMVAASLDALVLLFQSPRWRAGLDRDPVVAPVLEKRDGRMVDIVERRGEVGLAPELGDELFPGQCLSVGRAETLHQCT